MTAVGAAGGSWREPRSGDTSGSDRTHVLSLKMHAPLLPVLSGPGEIGPGAPLEDKDPGSMVCSCEALEATQVFIKGTPGGENRPVMEGRTTWQFQKRLRPKCIYLCTELENTVQKQEAG